MQPKFPESYDQSALQFDPATPVRWREIIYSKYTSQAFESEDCTGQKLDSLRDGHQAIPIFDEVAQWT